MDRVVIGCVNLGHGKKDAEPEIGIGVIFAIVFIDYLIEVGSFT